MRIAVIGGSGFIGHYLISGFQTAGHEVVNLDRAAPAPGARYNSAGFVQGDVTDQASLRQAMSGCDAAYLLAAEHRDDVSPVSRYYEVNVDGARNVAAMAAELGIRRIVFVSSVAIYGLDKGLATETSVPEPFNHYGRSKLEAESVMKEWAAGDAARALTMVRPCVIFGPGNRGNVYTLLKQISGRSFAMIGNGRNQKSMAYVENMAAFLAFCIDQPTGVSFYNYADKPDMSIGEIVSFARQQMGKDRQWLPRIPYLIGLLAGYTFDLLALLTRRKFSISAVRVQKFCASTLVDSRKAFATGFVAPVTLRDGLARMIAEEFPR